MQDTSPRTGADCLQEERASVFQLKELFFPPPLFFFPFSPRLWMCDSQVRCTKNRRMTAITFLYSWRHDWLIGAAWVEIERGWCSFHTSLFRSPSVSSINPSGHIKNRHPLKSTSEKQKCKHNSPWQQKSSRQKKKKSETSKREKRREKRALAFNIKLFQDRVPFLLFWWLSF